MKTIKHILFIFFTVSIISCGNPLDKSVTEELTLEELNKEVKNDAYLYEVYDEVYKFKQLNGGNKLVLSKYVDLTWRDYFEFMKLVRSDEYLIPVINKIKEDYTNDYGSILQQGQKFVDTMVAEYKAGNYSALKKEAEFGYYKTTYDLISSIRDYIEDESEVVRSFIVNDITRDYIDRGFVFYYDYQDVKLDSIKSSDFPFEYGFYKDITK